MFFGTGVALLLLVATGGAASSAIPAVAEVITVTEAETALATEALVGGAAGGAGNWIVSGQNTNHYINGFSGGMIGGIGMHFGFGTAIAGGALGNVLTTCIEEDDVTVKEVLLSALIGATSSAVGYGLSEKALGKSFYNKLIEGLNKNDAKIVKVIFEYIKYVYDTTLESIWNAISDLLCDD